MEICINILIFICTQTCKEAHEGLVLCAQRIAELFKEIEESEVNFI